MFLHFDISLSITLGREPYFNDLSAWSKAHGASALRPLSKSTFASLTTEKLLAHLLACLCAAVHPCV